MDADPPAKELLDETLKVFVEPNEVWDELLSEKEFEDSTEDPIEIPEFWLKPNEDWLGKKPDGELNDCSGTEFEEVPKDELLSENELDVIKEESVEVAEFDSNEDWLEKVSAGEKTISLGNELDEELKDVSDEKGGKEFVDESNDEPDVCDLDEESEDEPWGGVKEGRKVDPPDIDDRLEEPKAGENPDGLSRIVLLETELPLNISDTDAGLTTEVAGDP